MSIFQEPISERVWDIKYRYRRDDKIIDQTIEDTWRRVARAVSRAEKTKNRKNYEKQFYQIMENFRFLPGGRIFAGAGTVRKVTLFNCFVMDIGEDSLEGIFESLKEGALTLQQGGGVGYDFSILRPRGEMVETTGSVASGPVSFMRIWDSMSATMQSSGARRGAMMGTLRCDHPDIEEFIRAKSDPKELRQFNVSVIVTDEFMQAVKKDLDWELVFPVTEKVTDKNKVIKRRWSGNREAVSCRIFRTVKARELWQKIIKSAYDYAEPGVLFEDTINNMNPLWYCEWISATNPCGEIPLPPYGACDLGSINLTQFVTNPFSDSAQINWRALEETSMLATRFQDNVITVSKYPLKQQQKEALKKRRIGLGFTGLADALVMLGISYGSEESLKIAARIMKTIAHSTWQMSIELAREKGKFPLFKKNLYLKGDFVNRLPKDIRQGISRYGVRNSHHNMIAPAGTISILANNISSGLEPIFGTRFNRSVRTLSGETLKFEITDYALRYWQKLRSENTLPPAWVDAQTLSPEAHLQIQGAIQPFIDNAISKTINLPTNFPFEKLNEVYTKAYQLGLKGCTVFRPNPVTGSVLSIEDVDRCCIDQQT